MDLTERPAKRGTNGDLGYVQQKWFPEIFDLADKTPVGQMAGPIVTSDGKYSLIWVNDKISAVAKDFLDVKSDIQKLLVAQQQQEALRLWVEERTANTSIVINEDAIWATVDKDKYAAPATNP